MEQEHPTEEYPDEGYSLVGQWGPEVYSELSTLGGPQGSWTAPWGGNGLPKETQVDRAVSRLVVVVRGEGSWSQVRRNELEAYFLAGPSCLGDNTLGSLRIVDVGENESYHDEEGETFGTWEGGCGTASQFRNVRCVLVATAERPSFARWAFQIAKAADKIAQKARLSRGFLRRKKMGVEWVCRCVDPRVCVENVPSQIGEDGIADSEDVAMAGTASDMTLRSV
jgi:hypothetical protein